MAIARERQLEAILLRVNERAVWILADHRQQL